MNDLAKTDIREFVIESHLPDKMANSSLYLIDSGLREDPHTPCRDFFLDREKLEFGRDLEGCSLAFAAFRGTCSVFFDRGELGEPLWGVLSRVILTPKGIECFVDAIDPDSGLGFRQWQSRILSAKTSPTVSISFDGISKVVLNANRKILTIHAEDDVKLVVGWFKMKWDGASIRWDGSPGR